MLWNERLSHGHGNRDCFMSATIEIVDPLPTCSPHLMPFNIVYNGPAPIETYFRPKTAPKPTFGKTAQDTEEESDVQMKVEPDRYVAAFRGRIVQGTTVELPTGYSGILLKAPEEGKADKKVAANKPAPMSKSSRRATRNSRRTIDVDEDEIQEPDVGEEAVPEDEELPTRTLTLSSKFSSFVLWNPDIPVDEGKDEYLRSLSEWTNLAAEVRFINFCISCT